MHAVKLAAKLQQEIYYVDLCISVALCIEIVMADDNQLPDQHDMEAAQMSLMRDDIPALEKAMAEELGPRVDRVVPGKELLYNVCMAGMCMARCTRVP